MAQNALEAMAQGLIAVVLSRLERTDYVRAQRDSSKVDTAIVIMKQV